MAPVAYQFCDPVKKIVPAGTCGAASMIVTLAQFFSKIKRCESDCTYAARSPLAKGFAGLKSSGLMTAKLRLGKNPEGRFYLKCGATEGGASHLGGRTHVVRPGELPTNARLHPQGGGDRAGAVARPCQSAQPTPSPFAGRDAEGLFPVSGLSDSQMRSPPTRAMGRAAFSRPRRAFPRSTFRTCRSRRRIPWRRPGRRA